MIRSGRPHVASLIAVAILLLTSGRSGAAQGTADTARVVALLHAGKLAEARTQFPAGRLRAEDDTPSLAYLRGRIAYAADSIATATRAFESAAARGYPPAHYWLAVVGAREAAGAGIFAKYRLAKRIRENLERAVAMDHANLAAQLELIRYYIIAPWPLGGGFDTARRSIAVLDHVHPYWARTLEGALLYREGRVIESERALRGAIAMAPDSAAAHVGLGRLLREQGRNDEAFTSLARGVSLDSTAQRALYDMAIIGAEVGTHLDGAERAIRAYLAGPIAKDLPVEAAAHWRLGQILEKKGDLAGARTEFADALRRDPDDHDFDLSLRRLDRRLAGVALDAAARARP